MLAVAAAIIPLGAATAQQPTSNAKKIAGIVVLDGPYELAGGGGVLGYVLTRMGKKANFQPCTGKVQLVDESDLKRTPLDCEDEPAEDPHPLNVACNEVESQVAMVAAKVGDVSTVVLGTVFLKAADGYTQAVAPPPEDTWVQWNAGFASPYSVCGQKYVYLPKMGSDEAWIGVIKTPSQ
ncbi:hypothetical protein NKI98_21920 [Mesorhizobium sp. M0222]|uniref:hypothetical protein n=1 Tax=Mesorhizobium sp. M0222 TaxID=2956921 RepID=UPI0033381B32